MEKANDHRRLIELLYMRDRTLRRLRRSTALHEVWDLYQELKVLNVHIRLLEREPSSIAR
jgi:hypothetical protein